jgi:hypothetical protein
MPSQTTNNILMVSPDTFGYNTETAVSNTFQNKPGDDIEGVRKKAGYEFKQMVKTLQQNGIGVFQAGHDSEEDLPDAVFPNNWFSTHEGGKVILYPMLTANRRLERDKDMLEAIIDSAGGKITELIDLSPYENEGLVLEGTGSLVLDRMNNAVFAIESERTSEILFGRYCDMMDVPESRRVFFHANDKRGIPIYHTNVIMSIGEGFAVICDECINNSDRPVVLSALESLGHEVITITFDQMSNFCGNILNLKNNDGESIIVISERAKKNFRQEQLTKLQKYGRIVDVYIDTIETIGGGSARCMIGEIFV